MTTPTARALVAAVVAVVAALAGPVTAQDRPAGALPLPSGMPLYMPGARDVPLNPAAAALGRALFHDARLSADGRVSCARCHEPARAFTDGERVSTGVHGRTGARNTPTLVNRGFGEAQFWDGRVGTLIEQVLHPIEDPREMGMPRDDAAARIAADTGYVTWFRNVLNDVVSSTSLGLALAAYVATVTSGDAPFDRWSAGDTLAIDAQARLGRRLFDGKARCTLCHQGANFSDERFHNTGVGWSDGLTADSGRYLVTRRTQHIGAFKTPTLREIHRTAPYMHDGSLATVEDVIEFYDRGGEPNPFLSPDMRPLQLTREEKQALLAFLRSLSGRVREGPW
jgi:cytochrome c peroxidase